MLSMVDGGSSYPLGESESAEVGMAKNKKLSADARYPPMRVAMGRPYFSRLTAKKECLDFSKVPGGMAKLCTVSRAK